MDSVPDDAVGNCWVCGRETEWAFLDIGWQHPDCDLYPIEGPDGEDMNVKIIDGRKVRDE